jgi:hypothetical protein
MDVTGFHVRFRAAPCATEPSSQNPLTVGDRPYVPFPNIQAVKAEEKRDGLGEAKTALG